MKKIIFLLFITLFACQEKQEITIDKNISMRIPSHLKSCKNLNVNAFLQYQNPDKELYIMALKAEGNIILKQIKLDNTIDKKTILSRYVSYLKNNYKNQFQDFVVKSEVYSLDSLPKIKLEFSLKINFIKYYYQVVIFENKGFFYEIYFWTLNDFVPKNKKEIDQCVNSISIKL
jgi:hypothetical protein